MQVQAILSAQTGPFQRDMKAAGRAAKSFSNDMRQTQAAVNGFNTGRVTQELRKVSMGAKRVFAGAGLQAAGIASGGGLGKVFSGIGDVAMFGPSPVGQGAAAILSFTDLLANGQDANFGYAKSIIGIGEAFGLLKPKVDAALGSLTAWSEQQKSNLAGFTGTTDQARQRFNELFAGDLFARGRDKRKGLFSGDEISASDALRRALTEEIANAKNAMATNDFTGLKERLRKENPGIAEGILEKKVETETFLTLQRQRAALATAKRRLGDLNASEARKMTARQAQRLTGQAANFLFGEAGRFGNQLISQGSAISGVNLRALGVEGNRLGGLGRRMLGGFGGAFGGLMPAAPAGSSLNSWAALRAWCRPQQQEVWKHSDSSTVSRRIRSP